MTPLDERLARRSELYVTTYNIHTKQTSMPPLGFEPKISAGERPQTYAVDRAATATGFSTNYKTEFKAASFSTHFSVPTSAGTANGHRRHMP